MSRLFQDYFGNPAPPKGKFPFIKKPSPPFLVFKKKGDEEVFMYTSRMNEQALDHLCQGSSSVRVRASYMHLII